MVITRKKIKILTITVVLVFLTLSYLTSSDNNGNDKVAYIQHSNNEYSINLSGQRNLMSHDFFSLFKNSKYRESIELIIPKAEGIIEGKDVEISGKSNRNIFMGKISIYGELMNINLFYHRAYDNKLISYIWNGKYKLIMK